MPDSPASTVPRLGHAPRLRDEVIERAINRPGVYRFTGPRGEVLYVGKSVRVRERLLSYFRPGAGAKERELLRVTTGVEWEYRPNEFDALLREFRSIRELRPRFNRRHRRERRFAWVKLTGGAAPRLVASRKPAADGSRYFGPFPAPRGLPSLLDELALVLGLRDCATAMPIRFMDQLGLFPAPQTPRCARFDMGTCPAPCAARCTEAGYMEKVAEAERFLTGETRAPLLRLRARLSDAAGARHFEAAALLRDRAERLDALQCGIVEYREHLDSLSFVYRVPAPSLPCGADGAIAPGSAAAGHDADAGGCIGAGHGYLLVRGRVVLAFPIPPGSGPDPTLADRIRELLTKAPPGPEHLDTHAREELFLVASWFRSHPEERDRTTPYGDFLRELESPLTPTAERTRRPAPRSRPADGGR